MIELNHDSLCFRAPEVHSKAKLTIDFQRTFRIPDDDKDYPLPPGLGSFPMKHVDDFAEGIPPAWLEHGGVMLPMYQSEALWLNFQGHYPMAVKVAAGKVDAVTGEAWRNELSRQPQDSLADDVAFGLGVGDPFERTEESVVGFDVHEIYVEVGPEHLLHLLPFTGPQ